MRAPLLTLALLAPLAAQEQLYELHASHPQVNVRFGQSIDTDGGPLFAVGCPWEEFGGIAAGAAYVFDFAAGAQLHRLHPPDGQKWDQFGHDVAMHGDLLVVGAPEANPHGANSGAVYVFDLTNGAFLAKLTGPGAAANWRFGWDVDVNPDYIAVGAPQVSGAGDGKVFLFDATTFQHVRTIDSPWSGFLTGFGDGLALDGDRVASGSLFMGAAFVFDLNTGQELARVSGDGGVAFGYFGRACDLDGDTLLVGAHVQYSEAPGAGAVYGYHWPTETRLFESSPELLGPSEYYGASVYLTDRFVLGGAPRHNKEPIHVYGEVGNGAIWILDRETGFELGRVLVDDGEEFDGYGDAVAGNDDYFLVGASLDNDALPNAGSVYVHRMPQVLGVCYCSPAVPNSTGLPGHLEVLGATELSEDMVVLLAKDLPPNQVGIFLVSASADHIPMAGGGQGTLCLGAPIGRYKEHVASSGELGFLGLRVPLGELPLPIGGAIQPGDTWRFQGWYRDQNPTSTSNFTDAVAVTFL